MIFFLFSVLSENVFLSKILSFEVYTNSNTISSEFSFVYVLYEHYISLYNKHSNIIWAYYMLKKVYVQHFYKMCKSAGSFIYLGILPTIIIRHEMKHTYIYVRSSTRNPFFFECLWYFECIWIYSYLKYFSFVSFRFWLNWIYNRILLFAKLFNYFFLISHLRFYLHKG